MDNYHWNYNQSTPSYSGIYEGDAIPMPCYESYEGGYTYQDSNYMNNDPSPPYVSSYDSSYDTYDQRWRSDSQFDYRTQEYPMTPLMTHSFPSQEPYANHDEIERLLQKSKLDLHKSEVMNQEWQATCENLKNSTALILKTLVELNQRFSPHHVEFTPEVKIETLKFERELQPIEHNSEELVEKLDVENEKVETQIEEMILKSGVVEEPLEEFFLEKGDAEEQSAYRAVEYDRIAELVVESEDLAKEVGESFVEDDEFFIEDDDSFFEADEVTDLVVDVDDEVDKQVDELAMEVKENDKSIEKLPMEEDKEEEKCDEPSLAMQDLNPISSSPMKAKRDLKDEKFCKFLKIFKLFHFHSPIVSSLMQVPKHAEFLKRLLSNKRKLKDLLKRALIGGYSMVMHNGMSTKMKGLPTKVKELHYVKKRLWDDPFNLCHMQEGEPNPELPMHVDANSKADERVP